MKNKKVIGAGVIILAVALIVVLKMNNNAKVLEDLEKDRFVVTAQEAAKRDIQNKIFVSGSVKALEEAVLFPRTDGKLLRNVLREGDKVRKGQTVSYIEKDEVGATYEPVPVPSTITGTVGRVYLDPGAHVEKSTAVAFVVNQDKVRILLDVPERYEGQIYKGQDAVFMVESLPGKKFNAEVNIISPVVDVNSRSVRVELLADNKEQLIKSGMFVKTEIVIKEEKDVISVPINSVYTNTETQEQYVFIPRGDSAERRTVVSGLSDGVNIEILQGIKEGDVVLDNAFGLKDGSKIELRNV